MQTLQNTVFEKVRKALERVDARVVAAQVNLDTSVVHDLGLDSLRFVDLTIALEEALNIGEFPIQEWHDAESTLASEPRFTMGSLVALCIRCIDERSEKENDG